MRSHERGFDGREFDRFLRVGSRDVRQRDGRNMDGLLMRKILVVLVSILAAAAAHADIRRLMQAKGYNAPMGAECTGGCGQSVGTTSSTTEPSPDNSSCTLPATLPCTL